MSKTNRIIVIIAIILTIIFGIMLIIRNGNSKNSEEVQNETPTTNQIATKKTNGEYEIYNTDIKTNTGSTKLTATVKNISKSKTDRKKIEIVLLDEKSNEVGTINATIPGLEVNGTTEISAEDLKTYQNIYNFRIK